MKNEVATIEMVVLMAVQQKSMGSARSTKVVGHNNGVYDGGGTSRVTSGLWRNNNNHIETVVKHREACLGCSKHGNNNNG